MAADPDRHRHRGDDLLRDLPRSLIVGPQVLEDDREFVAAEPGDGVGGAHAASKARGDLLQQRVADLVAERVVDRLEAVEIDEHEREARALARRVDRRLLEPVVEKQAVG